MNNKLFRPSAMLRRKLCHGSLASESTLPEPPDEDANEYQAEGRELHRLIADPALDRSHLEPEQYDTLIKAEQMEAEFLAIIKNQP